jgi:hypothetical protein
VIDNSVEIRGLERHLELKELQKQKENDQKLREAEVFGLNHKFAVNAASCDIANPVPSDLFPSTATVKGQQREKFTVPEPFRLSTEMRGQ